MSFLAPLFKYLNSALLSITISIFGYFRLLPLIMKILSLLATSAFAGATSSCRCTSKDSCWPSQSQWESLNASISHNLIALRPYGSPCHAPSYDATLCNTITHNPNTNSVFRASMPAALQYPNWETLPSANQSCLVGTDKQIPCGQGRVSLYSALVKTPVQVQEAVRFAKKHNLRLAIRNTGHSYLGTSSAPESLQIFTHGLDNITVMESFIPHGAQRSRGSAVTIGAGVMLKDLYQALSQHGVIAVAGLSPSVGAAGGYVQGAGHSPLSPLLGLAADNVLQFTVVTAQVPFIITPYIYHLKAVSTNKHRATLSSPTTIKTRTSSGLFEAAVVVPLASLLM